VLARAQQVEKKIYASYIHSPKLSDTLLATYIDAADDEVDEATGTIWDGPTAKTEYFDGRRGHEYPATDRPFARDYDEPASVQLSQHNVTEITAAYFLQRGVGLSNVRKFMTLVVHHTLIIQMKQIVRQARVSRLSPV